MGDEETSRKERKGKEMKGKERKRKERTEKERSAIAAVIIKEKSETRPH